MRLKIITKPNLKVINMNYKTTPLYLLMGAVDNL